jgi:cellulose synthase operon protein YhjQ
MMVFAVVSMKGGVGKTSVTANIAAALAAILGSNSVGVIDLDPQNSLHLHFGQSASITGGLSECSIAEQSWQSAVYISEYGVDCIPYGDVNEAQREAFENLLEAEPNFIGDQLQHTTFKHKRIVLIDTPPGTSVYLRQASRCAELCLVVLLSDGGSYATLPAMESWLQEIHAQSPAFKSLYVFNQADGMNKLSQDVIEVVRQHLGERVVRSLIHSDEAVAEALAFQQPIFIYAPHSQAKHDIEFVASQLLQYVVQ